MLILFVASHLLSTCLAIRLNFLATPIQQQCHHSHQRCVNLLTHHLELNRTELKVLGIPENNYVENFVLVDLPLFFVQRYVITTFSPCTRNASIFYASTENGGVLQRIKIYPDTRIFAVDAICATRDRYGSCHTLIDYVFSTDKNTIVQHCRFNVDTNEESCQKIPDFNQLPDLVVLHNARLSLLEKHQRHVRVTIWPITTLVQQYFSRTFQNLRIWRSEKPDRMQLDIVVKQRVFRCHHRTRMYQVKTSLIDPNIVIVALVCEQDGKPNCIRYVEYHQVDYSRTLVRALPLMTDSRHFLRRARQHSRNVVISAIKQTPYTIQYLFSDGSFYDKRSKTFKSIIDQNNYTNVINDFIR